MTYDGSGQAGIAGKDEATDCHEADYDRDQGCQDIPADNGRQSAYIVLRPLPDEGLCRLDHRPPQLDSGCSDSMARLKPHRASVVRRSAKRLQLMAAPVLIDRVG